MNNSSSKNKIHIGILGAMPEEIGCAIKELNEIEKNEFGDLIIYSGKWKGHTQIKIPIYLSIAWSGWGKVSASRAATRLINTTFKGENIDLILFTGVAGAVCSKLNQWDVILPNALMQHDMDATPIFEKYVIPAINKKYIEPKKEIHNWIYQILKEGKRSGNSWPFKKIKKGLIATGDKFISDKDSLINLKRSIKGVLAVEMEGAAVAQVCYQECIPWIIIRVISDGANDDASTNFKEFVTNYEKYSWNLVALILKSISKDFTDFFSN